MLLITERLPQPCRSDADLLLSFELRSKTRLRTRTVDGEEAGLFLSAGAPLTHGQCLRAEDGRVVRVLAADEPLLHVVCVSPEALCRAAYHLGNRHVHLQVGEGWLRLLDDYVLAQMLQQMGAEVSRLFAPFNPESGAYGGGHHHSHGKEAAFQYAPRLHLFGQPT